MDASRGFEVEPRPVGAVDGATAPQPWNESSRRGPSLRPAVAWLALLVSVVSVAGIGRLVGSGPEQAVAELVGAPLVATLPGGAPARAPMPEIIVLSSPAVANATITSRELTIRGYLAGGTGTIQVTLEARGNRIIDAATIDPALVFAERPAVGQHAQFETRFGLPNPRPNGRMIVQVALLDDEGQVVDVVRRPIRVGPLLEGAAGA